ncbi:MAG: tryptophanase [Acidobacteria bacterium]|nr:tryptophanase [Acidobacteriota bacterium]
MHHRIMIEPFRIKSVEPIRFTDEKERRQLLRQAHYNLFFLHANDVMIDLLTDSGTGAMSAAQWGAVMTGDESYAGADSYWAFKKAVQDICVMPEVIPTHQGRAAERLMFGNVCRKGHIVPNNTHFDTTRANLEVLGVKALDLVIPEGRDPKSHHPFKGDMDIEALKSCVRDHAADIPFVMLTITNNSGGGQPVSMANVKAVKQVLVPYNIPLYIDAARFAENAYFIKMREPGYSDLTPLQIARAFFAHCDGVLMSAKKDGMANIGGFLALKDTALANRIRNTLILTEGFPTYGGLAGRDLAAIALGLYEALDEDYLRYRVRTSAYMAEQLKAADVPIMEPPGGHAIYIDARALLDHVAPLRLPGQSLACALYLYGGIRACEIGTVMFGSKDEHGNPLPAPNDLVRLAFPRRVYTQSHFDYVVEVVSWIAKRAAELPGMKITHEPPFLRHFTSHFEPEHDYPEGD